VGTVFKQPVRDRHHVTARDVLDHIDTLKAVAQEAGISLDQAIEVWRVMEQARANNIAVANGDVHDEQMAGFASILEAANEVIA
jgi:protein-disulfide isomerase-like protein with CxxC motif